MRRRLSIATLAMGLLAAWGLVHAPAAHAYPSAVIFAPTGASLAPGVIGLYYYAAAPIPQSAFTLTSWTGIEVGVAPTFRYGAGDGAPGFGGVELGLDVFGTNAGPYRTVLNVKATALTEGDHWPSIAVGLMQVDLEHRDISLDMAFLVMTKTITIRGTSIGTFTLGYGHSLNPNAGGRQSLVFIGSAPFSAGARGGLLLGYASPSVGPFSVVIDQVGGYSEDSSTNFGVQYTPVPWFWAQVGGYVSNRYDADHFFGGAYASLSATIDVPALATPASPAD